MSYLRKVFGIERRETCCIFFISEENESEGCSIKGRKNFNDTICNHFENLNGNITTRDIWEFTVFPRAMFSVDGRLLQCTDKAMVMHGIEDIVQATESADNTENIEDSLTIIHEISLTFLKALKVNSTSKQNSVP